MVSVLIGMVNISMLIFVFSDVNEINVSYIVLALFGLMPFIISLIFVFLAYKMRNKTGVKTAINIISLFYIVACAIYMFVWLFVYAIVAAMNPATNISSYEYNEHFDYFPKEIPDNCIDVAYFYRPGALQGGTTKLLYLKLDEKDIQKYKKTAQKRAIDKETNSHRHYHNTPYEDKEISSDFTTYVLEAECDDSGWCNHGLDEHIAINEKTNEIIFYYENW